jgi:hypothetical protein
MAKSVFTEDYQLLIQMLVAARKRARLTQQEVADKPRDRAPYKIRDLRVGYS